MNITDFKYFLDILASRITIGFLMISGGNRS